MNATERERLIRLLSDLVADGEITEEQAAGILLFMAELTGADAMIPLPTAQPAPLSDDDEAAILAMIATASGIAGITTAAELYRLGRRATRAAAADRLADLHEAQAGQLAAELARSGNLRRFQAAAAAMNRRHIAAQAANGARGWTAALSEQIAAIEAEQAAYLARFVDQAALRQIAEILPRNLAAALGLAALSRYSAEYLAGRLAQYGAAARGQFFRAAEEFDGESAGYGWIVRYIARDDDRTCGPCSDAQGYYLPGTGPYPGEICLGRHRCRCRREPVFAPDIYATLAAGA